MQNCFNFMSWHRFAWASLLVLLYKQHCLPRPVICTIKSASLNQIWQIVQGEGVREEKQQLTFEFPTLRLLCSLDLENPHLTELLVFFLKSCCFLIQSRSKGKMSLISTKKSICPAIYNQAIQLWQGCSFTPRLFTVYLLLYQAGLIILLHW